ncbi:hypothetical protein D9619_008170 [Psilocybe cf. subviscida]|uniref:Uncharacterized protein n=1 Tax=Psilocybe cf. subviscida TaxID=2480587 RepID=A0A8H5AU30_9AGAR|nr:hypothetical protein D9619_008170 [Psilocybe cf. subviscida]
MSFNPICNGYNVPTSVLSIIAVVAFNQCLTWSLILWKVRLRRMRRMRSTSGGHARISWGLCLVAILLGTSHSFAIQRCVFVYVFTLPTVVVSIGTCRYILQVERDSRKRAEAIRTAENRGVPLGGEKQSHSGALPTQDQLRYSYPPRQPAVIPSESDPEAPPSRTSSTEVRRNNIDTTVSNFPYLHGALSYQLTRKRNSMATTITHSATNHSARGSSDCNSQWTPNVRTSWSSRAGCSSSIVESMAADAGDRNDVEDETEIASTIEIGSLHSSSSVNSEELRRFDNDTWNVGPFMSMAPNTTS